MSILRRYGAELLSVFSRASTDHGLQQYIKAADPAANPYYSTVDSEGAPWFALRTLFAQEMIRQGVLKPWMAVAYRHGEADLQRTEIALQKAMSV